MVHQQCVQTIGSETQIFGEVFFGLKYLELMLEWSVNTHLIAECTVITKIKSAWSYHENLLTRGRTKKKIGFFYGFF